MSKPIRILHLITGLGRGGAETWLARLLSRLPRDRYDCRVCSLLNLSGPSGALAADIRALGIPVESLGMARGVPGPGALLRLCGLLRSFRPQVLQTWLYHADLLGLVAARTCGCGASVSWGLRCAYMDLARYGLGTRLTLRALAALSPLPQAVTANSHAGAAHHLALGYRPRRMAVLENGVDGGRFRPDAGARAQQRAAWGAAWGAADDEFLVGLVARVDPMKGHDVFCRAMALLRRDFPRARPVFCGSGTEPGGRELDAWLAQAGFADGADISGAAIRLGARADVEAVYPALDALALPSLGEGFPNVLAEALACGVPVAGLDVGDARRIAGPGGFVAEAEADTRAGTAAEASVEARAEALAGCLARLAGLSAGERAALGEAGRAHVLERYGLDEAVARWARHFDEMAAISKQQS